MHEYYLNIYHSGVAHDEDPPGRGSGRYPYGSGDRPFQDKEAPKALKALGSIVKEVTKRILISTLSTVGSIAITAISAKYFIASSFGQQLIMQAINGLINSEIGKQAINAAGKQIVGNVVGGAIGSQVIGQISGGSGTNMVNSLLSSGTLGNILVK